MENKKGFTLVELLAVIVILALIMSIAVISISSILDSSRQNTYKETAASIINGVRQQLILNNSLEEGRYYFESSILEKGGTSPSGSPIEFVTGASGSPLKINIASSDSGASDLVEVVPIGSMGVYKAVSIPSSKCGQDYISYVTVTQDPANTDSFKYGVCVTAGEGETIVSGTEEALLDGSNSDTVKDPATLINNPNAPTIAGGNTKIYNYAANTITCTASNTYPEGTTLYYEFGSSTTETGAITWTGTPSTTNTLSISKTATRTTGKYYACRVYATSATDTTDKIESSNRTLQKILNAKITFNGNGGKIGTKTSVVYYASYAGTVIYTSATAKSTTATMPTATKSGGTFDGWYDAASNGNKIINADGTFNSATVTGWIKSSKWAMTNTNDKTLYAHFS